MKRLSWWLLAGTALAMLAGCGPARKSVFPPMVRVQELQVQADGSWRMQLRIQNNSYDSMRFTGLRLVMRVDDREAGTLEQPLDLEIPTLSVDVTTVQLRPDAAAAQALATRARDGGAVAYALAGTVTAQPQQEKKPREFAVEGKDWLSPVPGIADTYR